MNNQAINSYDDVLSSPPVLSPSLSLSFQSLDLDMQRLFIRCYRYLWRVVHSNRFTEQGNILSCYWSVDLLRERAGLTNTQLCILSYLYQVTERGSNLIHSQMLYDSFILPGLILSSKQVQLSKLSKLGYIKRFNRDPSLPRLSANCFKHPELISLTGAGVKLIESIERDMYKILLNSSLQDMTGVIKKP